MHFELTDEQKALVNVAREFAAEKIIPFVDQWDRDHYFPYEEVIKPMAELGFLGTVIPEEYGGNDMGWVATMIVTEEIARACSSLRVQINMEMVGCAYPILEWGTDAVKQRYVPKLVSGEYLGGFAITEATAGSDVIGMKSRAEDKGDHWLLNGAKGWISNSNIADVVVYYAHVHDPSAGPTSRGRTLSAFVLPLKGTEGVITEEWDKLGAYLSPTGGITLGTVSATGPLTVLSTGVGDITGSGNITVSGVTNTSTFTTSGSNNIILNSYGNSFAGPGGFLEQRGAPKLVERSAAARDMNVARRLWDVSEELTGVRRPLRAPAGAHIQRAPSASSSVGRASR